MPGLDPITSKRTDKGQAAERLVPQLNTEFNAIVGEFASRAKHTVLGTYDFARDGGAIGSIGLKDLDGEDISLPAGSVVTRSFYFVGDAFTSDGSAQISLSIPTDDAAGLKAAAVLGTNGTEGWHEGIQDGAAANFSEECEEARTPTLDITVAALTAGSAHVFLEYVVLSEID